MRDQFSVELLEARVLLSADALVTPSQNTDSQAHSISNYSRITEQLIEQDESNSAKDILDSIGPVVDESCQADLFDGLDAINLLDSANNDPLQPGSVNDNVSDLIKHDTEFQNQIVPISTQGQLDPVKDSAHQADDAEEKGDADRIRI